MTRCFTCSALASHEVSLSDPAVPGYNLNECGYSWHPVCLGHYLEWRKNGGCHTPWWGRMLAQQAVVEGSPAWAGDMLAELEEVVAREASWVKRDLGWARRVLTQVARHQPSLILTGLAVGEGLVLRDRVGWTPVVTWSDGVFRHEGWER